MDTPQGHPALESVMLLIVADFIPNSAIFRALGLSSAPPQARRWGWIGVEVAELLMKSATVESGTYAQPRAAPLLDAGKGPADPSRHARRPALAFRPADGLIRKIANPRRPAITPG